MNESKIAPGLDYLDAAKRCSDHANMTAIVANYQKDMVNRWLAIRLSDGGTDGVAYPNRSAAIMHQTRPELCAYVWCPPDGMTPQQAEIFLTFNRKAYDAGFKMTDPELIQPITNEGMSNQLARIGKK